MRLMIARFASLLRRLAACRNGSNAFELAIILPVLTLMVVGAVYAGWMLFSTNMLFYAVESAARCASVNTTTCGGASQSAQVTNVKAYAVTQAMGLNVTAASFTVTQPANGCGWQVTGTYPFTFMMPFTASNPVFTITASACFPVD